MNPVLNHYFVGLVLGTGFGCFAATLQILPRAVVASMSENLRDE